MDVDDLELQIRDMQERVALLQRQAGESLSQQQQLDIIERAFREIATALEELQVANEELESSNAALCRQNQELTAAQAAVEAERQRYQELFEFAPDAYLVTDNNGVIQEANSAACKLFNISQTFLVGVPLDIYVVEEEQQTFRSKLARMCLFDGVQEWEVRLRSRNTKPISAAVRVAAVRERTKFGPADRVDQIVGLRWLLRDITQWKQVQEALKQAKEAADAANRAKSTFLANMSHELRTPLNVILGFSQLMVCDNSLCKEHLEHLRIINRSGEHLLELINDILSISKIEAGQLALNENRFDLYQLLNSLYEMLRLKAIAKGLQLFFEIPPDVPRYIETDERKLRQVLINLLGNAIKFTTTGSVTLRVKAGTGDWRLGTGKDFSQSPITFEISDTGPGIAPEELSTIFEPFVQTELGRQMGQGTGLGLPISQQFVRLMGGDIAVSSQLGRGTTFTFDIKLNWVTEANEKTISVTRRVIGLQPNQPPYRILVVEDVEENRQLLVKMLAPLGFEVREASNGQQGVSLWQSWEPHLIWMDMRMPILNGYEATKQIKHSPKAKDTVIIALTASAYEEQQSQILKAGCDDFVCKPFQAEVLFEKMAKHLGVRYIYQEELPPTSTHLAASPKLLSGDDLTVMPRKWVTNLRRAALALDEPQLIELIEQIPESEATMATALIDLVDNFHMDIIVQLAEACIDE